LADVVRKKSVDILKDENDRDVMAEIFRCLSDSLIDLGPGILGTDERETTEIIAITLLILERDHPSLNDDDENRLPDDEERAEIELVLINAAVDVVLALATALKGNFIRDFGSFYQQLVKFTVHCPNVKMFLTFVE
jgi:importin-4